MQNHWLLSHLADRLTLFHLCCVSVSIGLILHNQTNKGDFRVAYGAIAVMWLYDLTVTFGVDKVQSVLSWDGATV